jgi:hypothetical protein
MGLLDSILSAVSGAQKPSGPGEANPLLGVLSGLLAQSGGLQGLANKFSQSQGDAFSSWGWLGRKPARFPAIKFNKRLVPTKFVHLRREWE